MNQSHALLSNQGVGKVFTGLYMVESVVEKTASNGNKYTDLTIRDKSGSRVAKYWGILAGIKRGDFVACLVTVTEYQGQPSFVANDVYKDNPPADLSNYCPTFEIEGTWGCLMNIVDLIKEFEASISEDGKKDNTCSVILDGIFSDQQFVSKFKSAPGSVTPYYGKIGGTLERTYKIASVCYSVSSFYVEKSQLPILLTAAILHRCGGAFGFKMDMAMPEYTESGMLLGISELSMMRVKSVVDSLRSRDSINMNKAMTIMHCIRSSSGSDIKPMCIEAIVLSMASKMDFNVSEARDFIENSVNFNGQTFTALDPTLRRKFFKSEEFFDMIPKDADNF